MISFYTPGHPYLGVLGQGSKHGRAFDLWDRWGGEWVGRDVLFLGESPLTPNAKDARNLQAACARYEPLPPIELHYRGRVVRRLYPALGRRVRGDPFAAVRRSYLW